MHIALLLLWVMNAADGLFTFYFVDVRQVATEINPIMQWCIERGWGTFFAVKLALGTLGAQVLWRRSWTGVLKVVVLALIWVYALICSWHLFGIYLVLKGVL